MSKTVFIIATILISVALFSHATQDNHHGQKHHKRQHSVGHHNAHLPEHFKHPVHEVKREKNNHGPVPVPLAPHHAKSKRNGRHHLDGQRKAQKDSHSTKGHQQQMKNVHQKVHHTRKHGHGHGKHH